MLKMNFYFSRGFQWNGARVKAKTFRKVDFYEYPIFIRFIVRKISNLFYRYVRKQVDFYKHLWYNINKKKKDVKKMESRTYYYARVSSREQNLDRQILAFQSLGADERSIFTDHESGKSLERPQYQALKNAILRKGDTLVIKSLDRLSRNKTDIYRELQYFKENNIRLKVIDLPTTMLDLPEEQNWVFDMVNNILIEVLGTIAEQEREMIRKRQAEGIEAAKQKGKKLGRPALTFPENWDEVYADWNAGKITAKRAMELTGTKRTSFYKLVAMKNMGNLGFSITI